MLPLVADHPDHLADCLARAAGPSGAIRTGCLSLVKQAFQELPGGSMCSTERVVDRFHQFKPAEFQSYITQKCAIHHRDTSVKSVSVRLQLFEFVTLEKCMGRFYAPNRPGQLWKCRL